MSFNRARVSPEVASAAYYLCFGLPVAAFGAKMYSVYAPRRAVRRRAAIDRSIDAIGGVPTRRRVRVSSVGDRSFLAVVVRPRSHR